MRRLLTTVLLALAAVTAVTAQGNWGLRSGIGLEKGIAKGLDAEFEAKYHMTDDFSRNDRWSVGLSMSKRLYCNKAKTFNVKAGLGYKYLHVYNKWTTKFKGDETLGVENGLDPQYYVSKEYDFNMNDPYEDSRHRVTASLQAAVELGRFKFSWRESYQYTHTDSASFTKEKYRYDSSEKKWNVKTEPDGKAAQDKQLLRSRIGAEYNIPHWKYDPFISYELFNNLDKGLRTEKSRINVGIEFSLNKKHNFEVSYLWQNNHDDDEPAGSFVCLGYKFEL